MPEAMSIMNGNAERFAPIVTSVFPLDDATAAFAEAADAARSSKVLLSSASTDRRSDDRP
jgi:threonine dehydrogenase-like Zn-dependent dehydrogenase